MKIRYITHPEVEIDPGVPVPRWGLNDRGRARAEAMLAQPWIRDLSRIISSDETKALELAEMLATTTGLSVEVRPRTGENDRSSTGFVSPERFDVLVDQFFAHPGSSTKGWERAEDAQRRITTELEDLLGFGDRAGGPAQDGIGDTAVIGHGAVGTLWLCHLKREAIDRNRDQPGQGHYFTVDGTSGVVEHGWHPIDDLATPSSSQARHGADAGLYRRDGVMFHPTDLTTGPWRPDAQHGGPPSGLLALLCEEQLEPHETLARMHVNLLASVPLEPLLSVTRRTAVSRRVAHVHAELYHNDRKVAEGTGLALAQGEAIDPDWSPAPSHTPLWTNFEESIAPHWATDQSTRPFHRDGIEHRFVEGRFDGAGSAVDWVRLKQPVVDGAPVSGYQRAMAVVDVGSGISAVFDPKRGFGLINADLNVAFVAEPEGPWLRLEAVTRVGRNGTGMAVTTIHDQHRLVAVATQSLLGQRFTNG